MIFLVLAVGYVLTALGAWGIGYAKGRFDLWKQTSDLVFAELAKRRQAYDQLPAQTEADYDRRMLALAEQRGLLSSLELVRLRDGKKDC